MDTKKSDLSSLPSRLKYNFSLDSQKKAKGSKTHFLAWSRRQHLTQGVSCWFLTFLSPVSTFGLIVLFLGLCYFSFKRNLFLGSVFLRMLGLQRNPLIPFLLLYLVGPWNVAVRCFTSGIVFWEASVWRNHQNLIVQFQILFLFLTN